MTELAASKPALFRNRFIQFILLSGIFLQIGIWVRNFAILLFVMEKTDNDPFAVSLISVAEFAPIFLFSFIGGTFADRWKPKRTMIWCDVLSAVSVFVVMFTLMYGSWRAVFFATLVSAILSQFSQPSAMKLFKQHVPTDQLSAGMAMFQTLMAIFMIIGPILGTFVFQNFGIQSAIAVMGIAFLLSAGVLAFLPPDRTYDTQNSTSTFWEELTDGFRYVWSRTMLRTLGAVFAAAGLAVGVIQPMLIFVVVERLGMPKEAVQWLMMANGAAMLVGGALVMGISKKVSPQKLLAIGMLASAVAVFGIGLSTNWWLTIGLEILNGLFFPCIHIGVNTLILKNSDEAYVGRVNGVLNPLFMGMMVLTMSAAGWLKDLISLVGIFSASGILFFVGMLFLIPLFKLKSETDASSSS